MRNDVLSLESKEQHMKTRSFCSLLQSHPPTHTHTLLYSLGNSTKREENWVSHFLYGTCATMAFWSQRNQCVWSRVEQVDPPGHTWEYNRRQWIGLWLCFQGVIFELDGSICLCFQWSFSGRQQTAIKMFSIAQGPWEINLAYNHNGVQQRTGICVCV